MSTYQYIMILSSNSISLLEKKIALSILIDRGYDVIINGVQVTMGSFH